jgi:hypothetical protein
MDDYDKNIFWIGIALASLLYFLISLYSLQRNWYEIQWTYFGDENSFSKTEGTIQQSDIGEGQEGTKHIRWYYFPKITYFFVADHVQYESHTISFAEVRFAHYENAKSYLSSYPTGGKVQVFYDPDNPGISVLDPKGKESFIITFLGILSLPVFSIVFIIRRYFKSKYKQAGPLFEDRLDDLVHKEENS